MVLAVRQGDDRGREDQRALHWLAATADGTFEWISSVRAWHSLDFHNAPVLDNAMTALYHMGARQSCDDTTACGTFRMYPDVRKRAVAGWRQSGRAAGTAVRLYNCMGVRNRM